MFQVKIFEGGDAEELESQVNAWLESNMSVEVMHVTQSESAVKDEDGDFVGNTTLSIFYRRR